MEQSGKGTKRKGLLTGEVKATENTNKDKTTKHTKIRVMALILCMLEILNKYIVFLS